MPTFIDIEPALLRWQAEHNERLTYEELAKRAEISIAALYRMKSGAMIAPDLRKINQLCKVLECEPGDIIRREETGRHSELSKLDVEYLEIKRELERDARKHASQSRRESYKSRNS
ncbi:MAG: helix-turn-helix transcriptional regulator [Anaerolineaceae bacterium]|nr:helix-turn-helix transcriptional regulator [Anaerolineae bacterium]MCB9459872.1 helix-turn-helix transcriptional regulator [Anaerolineaceae bacterium]